MRWAIPNYTTLETCSGCLKKTNNIKIKIKMTICFIVALKYLFHLTILQCTTHGRYINGDCTQIYQWCQCGGSEGVTMDLGVFMNYIHCQDFYYHRKYFWVQTDLQCYCHKYHVVNIDWKETNYSTFVTCKSLSILTIGSTYASQNVAPPSKSLNARGVG